MMWCPLIKAKIVFKGGRKSKTSTEAGCRTAVSHCSGVYVHISNSNNNSNKLLSASASTWLGDGSRRINSQPAPKYTMVPLANGSLPSSQKTSTEELCCCLSSLAPCRGRVEWRQCLSPCSPGPAEHRGISRCSAIPPHPICKKKMRWRKRGERHSLQRSPCTPSAQSSQ